MKDNLSFEEADILPYIRDGTFPIIIAFSGGKDSVAMVLFLLEQGIDRRRIHLDAPIKAIGTHRLTIRLHPEVEATVNVEVVPG